MSRLSRTTVLSQPIFASTQLRKTDSEIWCGRGSSKEESGGDKGMSSLNLQWGDICQGPVGWKVRNS